MKRFRISKFKTGLVAAMALAMALPVLTACGSTPTTSGPAATTTFTTSPAAPATTTVTTSTAATATTTTSGPTATTSSPTATATSPSPTVTTTTAPATTTPSTTTPPTTTEPTATGTPTATGATVEKEIRTTSFIDGTFTIPAGTTVVWTNKDSLPHTVSARDGSFESGTLVFNGTFQVTFDTPGVYEYSCRIHPFMTGTITVTAS